MLYCLSWKETVEGLTLVLYCHMHWEKHFHRGGAAQITPAHRVWLKMIHSCNGARVIWEACSPGVFNGRVHSTQLCFVCNLLSCAKHSVTGAHYTQLCVCAHYTCGADYYSQAGGRKAKEREHDGDTVGTFVSYLLGARIVIMKSELH